MSSTSKTKKRKVNVSSSTKRSESKEQITEWVAQAHATILHLVPVERGFQSSFQLSSVAAFSQMHATAKNAFGDVQKRITKKLKPMFPWFTSADTIRRAFHDDDDVRRHAITLDKTTVSVTVTVQQYVDGRPNGECVEIQMREDGTCSLDALN